MMMLLGMISSRRSAGTRCRRQRFRNAIATAFLASSWPTMYLSSSATICCGVSSSIQGASSTAGTSSASGCFNGVIDMHSIQFQNGYVAIGEDADVGGDLETPPDDVRGRQLSVILQRASRRQRIGAP